MIFSYCFCLYVGQLRGYSNQDGYVHKLINFIYTQCMYILPFIMRRTGFPKHQMNGPLAACLW